MRGTDRDRFDAFCQRQYPVLVGVLTLYVAHGEDAEDLAQEALARTWRDWPRIRSVEAAPAYAHRTALNLAKNHFRRRDVRRRHKHLLATDHRHTDPDGADTVVVRQAVAGLPDRQRAALVLRYYGGLSVDETATVLDVPANTVKTLTRRALLQLRDTLDDVPTEEAPHAR